MNRSAVGSKGEDLARKALRSKGMRVLARNHRTRLGEVDLICQDRDTVVFVEVKARTSDAFGHPLLAVGQRKQKKLRSLAQEFLAARRLEDRPVRFDVVSVRLDCDPPEVEHIAGAF
ncbi:MAG: YraN family protein [candidate division WOR-3 bacterium]|nr:MAG: YraN family protein [candidate division WOR-3 bacterium]